MSTSGVPISAKSLLYSFQPISSLTFEFRSSETCGCETQRGYILTYVNSINFRFFYFSQNLVILLVASRQLKFQFSRLCDFPKTRYERLNYLFYDTPNLHSHPLFQSDSKLYTANNSWHLINTQILKKKSEPFSRKKKKNDKSFM